MNGTQIEAAMEEKDLGIIIDRQLKYHSHASAASSKASQMLAVVHQSFTNVDEVTLLLLFKSNARPFLEYGNMISDLGTLQQNETEAVGASACTTRNKDGKINQALAVPGNTPP